MHKRRKTGYQKNIGSVTLFALAVFVLVISCPLKRLLINSAVSQNSLPSSSNQTKTNQHFSSLFNNNTTCSAERNTTAILQADNNLYEKRTTPLFTENIFNYTDYFIQPFLNGDSADYYLVRDVNYPSLPLFLKHRSLLV